MISKLTMSLFFNTSWAIPLFLWKVPQNEIKNGFYRFILGISAILWGIGSILFYFNISSLEDTIFSFSLTLIALFLIIGFTAIAWNKINISLIQISIICTILASISYFLHLYVIINVNFLNPAFLIGVFCLSNVLFAMILGHWFLNVPNLKIVRLKKIVNVLGILLIIRCIWDVYSIYSQNKIYHEGNVINGYTYLFSIEGVFLWIALFFGLFAPIVLNFMTGKTLKIFSTQAATGLLYINVVLILMSELIFKFYLIQYNWVL